MLAQMDERRFAFAHHQIRDIAYERIQVDSRRALHRAAATAIESMHRDDADFPLRFVSLARHWEGADAIANAVEYLDKAGDYALRTSAYMDTVRLFGKAADFSGRHLSRDQRARRAPTARHRRSVAGARRLRDQPAPSGPRGLDSRFPVAGDEGPEDSRAARRAGPAGHPSARPGPRPGACFNRPRRSRPRVREPADRLAIHGESRAGPDLHGPALPQPGGARRGTRHGRDGVLAGGRALRDRAAACRRAEVRTARERGAGAHDRPQRPLLRADRLSVFHTGIGNWDAAAAYAGRSAQIAIDVGFRRRREDALAVCGFVEIARWRLPEACGFTRISTSPPRRGSQRGQIWSIGALGVLALRTGDRREAEARLREFEALRPAELDPSDRVRLDAAAGLLAAHLDEPGARKALDRALDAWRKVPPVLIESIDPCVRLAEAYVMLMRKAAAFGGTEMAELDKQFTRTCAYAQRLAKRFPIVVPDERHWRAEADWLLGRQSAALKHWQTASPRRNGWAWFITSGARMQSLADHHPDATEAARHRSSAAEQKERIDVVRN